MKFPAKDYSPSKAKQRFSEMAANNAFVPQTAIDPDGLPLRREITSFCADAPDMKSPYLFDVYFGTHLFALLKNKYDFSTIDASNYDFWRYLSLEIIPDIIYQRRNGSESIKDILALSEYFYKKPVRIYPASCCWYAMIFWQGTVEDTIAYLTKDGYFTADAIVASVERLGLPTYNRKIYREIFDQYTNFSQSQMNKARAKGLDNVHIIRAIFVQHTAKCLVFIPELVDEPDVAIKKYVSMLIEKTLED